MRFRIGPAGTCTTSGCATTTACTTSACTTTQLHDHPARGDVITANDADDEPRRAHHRPARYADLTGYLDAIDQDVSPDHRAEVAAATAAAVISQGRSQEPGVDLADFVALADRVGLDTLTALWRDAGPTSLPGALWVLYVVRAWCRHDPDGVVRLWRAGEHLAGPDAVVAGVAATATADDIVTFADAALTGVYQGDVDVALERIAAFLRVVAMGRRWWSDASEVELSQLVAGPTLEPDGVGIDTPADRNERVARDLGVAAQRWRAGTLH